MGIPRSFSSFLLFYPCLSGLQIALAIIYPVRAACWNQEIASQGGLLKYYIVVRILLYMGKKTISGNVFRNIMAQQCQMCGGFRGVQIQDDIQGLLMPCRCGDEE